MQMDLILHLKRLIRDHMVRLNGNCFIFCKLNKRLGTLSFIKIGRMQIAILIAKVPLHIIFDATRSERPDKVPINSNKINCTTFEHILI